MEQDTSPDNPGRPSPAVSPQISQPARRPWGTLLVILLVGGAVAWIAVRFHQGMSERFNSAHEWQTDVDDALSLARQSHRPVLMVFTSDACIHCKRLKAGVLSTKESDDAIAGRVIPAMLNISEVRHRKLLEEFGSNVVPTVVITDSTGETVAMFNQAPAKLPNWIVTVTEKMKKQ